MKKTGLAGRPSLQRNAIAGKHLGLALKLLGKTWRRDTDNPTHVHHWQRWTDCGLPRSATTIDQDIREGIPDTRLAAYARCLELTAGALVSSETDILAVLDVPVPGRERAPSKVSGYRDRFPERYLKHNPEHYIRELFGLLQGVYRMRYLLSGVDEIHNCTLWIHRAESYRLLMRGRFSMFGVENPFNADMFRWHNNLHVHYLCENGFELGYALLIDPLRHHLVRRRKPFWLKGRGLTDRGLADNLPISFVLRMEKLPQPGGMPLEDLYLRECGQVLQRPAIDPDDPDYEALRTDLLKPDDLR